MDRRGSKNWQVNDRLQAGNQTAILQPPSAVERSAWDELFAPQGQTYHVVVAELLRLPRVRLAERSGPPAGESH
jgi:hypothetical protein